MRETNIVEGDVKPADPYDDEEADIGADGRLADDSMVGCEGREVCDAAGRQWPSFGGSLVVRLGQPHSQEQVEEQLQRARLMAGREHQACFVDTLQRVLDPWRAVVDATFALDLVTAGWPFVSRAPGGDDDPDGATRPRLTFLLSDGRATSLGRSCGRGAGLGRSWTVLDDLGVGRGTGATPPRRGTDPLLWRPWHRGGEEHKQKREMRLMASSDWNERKIGLDCVEARS
jgi:hypothetical protein